MQTPGGLCGPPSRTWAPGPAGRWSAGPRWPSPRATCRVRNDSTKAARASPTPTARKFQGAATSV